MCILVSRFDACPVLTTLTGLNGNLVYLVPEEGGIYIGLERSEQMQQQQQQHKTSVIHTISEHVKTDRQRHHALGRRSSGVEPLNFLYSLLVRDGLSIRP